MPDLDTLSWYALGIPLYLVLLTSEWVLGRRRRVAVFSFPETISNLTAGLGTLLVGLFAGPFVLRAWDWTHAHLAPVPWPSHGLWRWPLALLLADLCYYLYHRAGHRFALFWAIHGIHHQHEHMNSTVGFRLEWLADPYAALFFGLMPIAGVDSTTGFAAIAALSVYALLVHCPVFSWASGGLLVTPAVHGAHHSRDARYSSTNYAAMLALWDRALGTWREPPPGETLRRDVPSIARTHDGVSAQWGLLVELVGALRRSPSPRAALASLVTPPVLVEAPALRSDDALSPTLRRYVLVQFVGLAAVGVGLLGSRGVDPLAGTAAGVLLVLFGLHALGALLDGRAGALARERLRLGVTLAGGAALAGPAPAPAVGLLAVAAAGVAGLPSLVLGTGGLR